MEEYKPIAEQGEEPDFQNVSPESSLKKSDESLIKNGDSKEPSQERKGAPKEGNSEEPSKIGSDDLQDSDETQTSQKNENKGNPPKAYLVYFPTGMGHVAVRIKNASEELHEFEGFAYWSWGGQGSLKADTLYYGEPIHIPICEIEPNSIKGIKKTISALFKERPPYLKSQILATLGLALISGGIATGIYYKWDLTTIPKMGEKVPVEATTAMIAFTIFVIACLLAYKLGLFDRNPKNTFNDATYAYTGLGGKNCAQAAQIIISSLADHLLNGTEKEELKTLDNRNTLRPKKLAENVYKLRNEEALYNEILDLSDNLNSWHEILKLANHIKAYEQLGNNHNYQKKIEEIKTKHPAISLIMAIHRMSIHAAKAKALGWCPTEATKLSNIVNPLLPLIEAGNLNHSLFQNLKNQLAPLHLDLHRRLGNTSAILFYVTAAATPAILYFTGKLDKLPTLIRYFDQLPAQTSKILKGIDYGVIFLVTALLASYAIARLANARLPFFTTSKSLTQICKDVEDALVALDKPIPAEKEEKKPLLQENEKDTSQSKHTDRGTDEPILAELPKNDSIIDPNLITSDSFIVQSTSSTHLGGGGGGGGTN